MTYNYGIYSIPLILIKLSFICVNHEGSIRLQAIHLSVRNQVKSILAHIALFIWFQHKALWPHHSHEKTFPRYKQAGTKIMNVQAGCNCPPLKKGCGLSLNKLSYRYLVSNKVEVAPVVLEKIFKRLQCIFAIISSC